MKKMVRFAVGVVAGMLSGLMMVEGIITFGGRNGTVGGEVLILPLIATLIVFGYQVGVEKGFARGKQLGIEKGFNDGYEEGFFEADELAQQAIKHIKDGYKEKEMALAKTFETMNRADEVIARAKMMLRAEEERRNGGSMNGYGNPIDNRKKWMFG